VTLFARSSYGCTRRQVRLITVIVENFSLGLFRIVGHLLLIRLLRVGHQSQGVLVSRVGNEEKNKQNRQQIKNNQGKRIEKRKNKSLERKQKNKQNEYKKRKNKTDTK